MTEEKKVRCWFCRITLDLNSDNTLEFDQEYFCSEACLWTYKKIKTKEALHNGK